MSGRFSFRGYAGRQNDNSPRSSYSILKASTLPNVSNPNSLLYDKNDFPSLSGSSEHTSSDPEVKVLKYSDKLKSSSQTPTHLHFASSLQDSHSKNSVSNQGSKHSFTKYSNESRFKDTKEVTADEHTSQQSKDLKNKTYANSTLTKSDYGKSLGNTSNKTHALKSNNTVYTKSNSQIRTDREIKSNFHNSGIKTEEEKFIQSMKQNNRVVKPFNSASNKISALSSSNNIHVKSSYESPSNREIKCDLMFDKIQLRNEAEKVDVQGKTAKKKKRRSKVKRQAALQTGKVNVLTAEVHSKILNQGSALNTKNVKSILTDINDEEEYPELGKSFTPLCQKENALKKENAVVVTSTEEKASDASAEVQLTKKEFILSNETVTPEKKVKPNKPVHLNDPITVTFFDMLMAKSLKTKGKELKEEIATIPTNTGLPKVKSKKGLCQAPNTLDSSCPVIKRGKERENPKPKKPSHLKKIILLDRKLRREQFLQLRSNDNQEANENIPEPANLCDNAIEETVISDDLCDFSDVSINSQLEECCEESEGLLPSSHDDTVLLSLNKSVIAKEKCNEKTSVTLLTSEGHDSDKATIESTSLPIEKHLNVLDSDDKTTIESSSLSTEKHLNVLESNDSLLKSLNGSAKSTEVCEKSKAARILLHTRNFREYCNHLISKDIDDAVHALLDDLARFQDRMHQKDPVKARVKRRMIYGVKEVKKHIKLKKLKCIIIATDIENVETEGGLNDILNDIKSLSADHNIPCVFALGRKPLGKVCRKPVPVSCIGVFNSDGSEANYKKIVELVVQSKKDYAEILNNLISKITDEETAILLKAKKEAPETLHDLRSNILREYFLPPQSDSSIDKEANSDITDLDDSELL